MVEYKNVLSKEHGEQLLSTCFAANRLQAMVDTHKELISPVIEIDPTVAFEVWEKGVEYLREAMPILKYVLFDGRY